MVYADGIGLLQKSLTGVKGRLLRQFAKEAEAVERLGATLAFRDVSIVVQPADFVMHILKQTRASVKCCEEFLLN